MDELWSYLADSPLLIALLVVAIALVLSRVMGGVQKPARPEDLVPHYKRFERREPEFGDRRKSGPDAKPAGEAPAEQRKQGRRKKD